MCLKGTRFTGMKNIKWNATVALREIPQKPSPLIPTWSKHHTLKVIIYASPYVLPLQYNAPFRELFDCPSYFAI
jgi:hypothetical protein